MQKKRYHVYFDGACDNNGTQSSPMGMGVVFKTPEGEVLQRHAFTTEKLGTSNMAEWGALSHALRLCLELGQENEFVIYGDSQLIVNQFNNAWRVKNEFLKPYFDVCRNMANTLGNSLIAVHWIRRHKNTEADEESKRGLEIYFEAVKK